MRQPDGTLKLYGAIPPRGANLIFHQYRTGGGAVGNVQAGILNTLKTAIPYVARVSNRRAAQGGLDAETLQAAMMRAPKLLRSRDRAVTESDFEFLARQAIPEAISRVKCLQPRPSEAGRVNPGQVYVLVIPRIADPDRYLAESELAPNDADVARLTDYLDERRLLTTRLNVRAPAYRWVAVKVQLRAAPGVAAGQVEADVLARLYHFLNPLTGVPMGTDGLLAAIYTFPTFTNASRACLTCSLFGGWRCALRVPAAKGRVTRWSCWKLWHMGLSSPGDTGSNLCRKARR